MSVEQSRAQRWHDTDHGVDRPAPRRWYGKTTVVEPELDWVSACWCCCELCDPDWEPPRPNPYWSRAVAHRRPETPQTEE